MVMIDGASMTTPGFKTDFTLRVPRWTTTFRGRGLGRSDWYLHHREAEGFLYLVADFTAEPRGRPNTLRLTFAGDQWESLASSGKRRGESVEATLCLVVYALSVERALMRHHPTTRGRARRS